MLSKKVKDNRIATSVYFKDFTLTSTDHGDTNVLRFAMSFSEPDLELLCKAFQMRDVDTRVNMEHCDFQIGRSHRHRVECVQ